MVQHDKGNFMVWSKRTKVNEQQTCRQLIAMSVLFDITGGMSYSALYDSDRKNQVYLILENKGKPNII